MDMLNLDLALANPRYLSPVSAWVEHIPFAFALVEMLRPRTIVELGTHMGDSYLAFCQAVDMLKLDTRCTAVDTWTGDTQAGNYSGDILDELRTYHDPLYSRFSTLLKSTFDDAAPRFPSASVDLLHIDGLHTYDAVKRDFEIWLPKLSRRAVVLLHDTQVKRDDFGVHKLWEKLAHDFSVFEFVHGYGLGVLAVGDRPEPALRRFLKLAAANPQKIRRTFEVLGNRVQLGRGLERLSQLSAQQQPALEQTLAPLEQPAKLQPTPAIDLFNTSLDLKHWLDLRGQEMEAQNHALRRIADHVQWLRDKVDFLARTTQPASLCVYWTNRRGHWDDACAQTTYLPTNGRQQRAVFRFDLPDKTVPRRVRIDPGDRPALWVLEKLALRVTQPGRISTESDIPVKSIIRGAGMILLNEMAPLDSAAMQDYVLFCHTHDPQLELRLADLLPSGRVTLELTMVCRILDSFGAYATAPLEEVAMPCAGKLDPAWGATAAEVIAGVLQKVQRKRKPRWKL